MSENLRLYFGTIPFSKVQQENPHATPGGCCSLSNTTLAFSVLGETAEGIDPGVGIAWMNPI